MCSKYVQGKNCQSNTLDIGLVMLSRCMSFTLSCGNSAAVLFTFQSAAED